MFVCETNIYLQCCITDVVSDKTTVRIDTDTRDALNRMKPFNTVSYDEVIRELIRCSDLNDSPLQGHDGN